MNITDFDYHLPEQLIARYPLANRSDSRLLYLDKHGERHDKAFKDLPSLLQAGDLLVFNDTKVMKARLFGQKQTGGKIEILVERIISDTKDYQSMLHDDCPYLALCHIKASKAPKAGTHLHLDGSTNRLCVLGRQENLFVVGVDAPILPILDSCGELPIPPYFERHADTADDTRYQTVFHDPNKLASVAAPTASLHFDETLLGALANQGIAHTFVTLHVGAGTFAPIKTDNIKDHIMHKEYAELPPDSAALINQTRQNGGKIIAVGTTVTRVLETAFAKTANIDNPTLSAWAGDTDIFIYPPYHFGVVDKLITNFHLPKSTLLMLVSALAGTDKVREAYQHAIQERYRFFSYGDAMLIEKPI